MNQSKTEHIASQMLAHDHESADIYPQTLSDAHIIKRPVSAHDGNGTFAPMKVVVSSPTDLDKVPLSCARCSVELVHYQGAQSNQESNHLWRCPSCGLIINRGIFFSNLSPLGVFNNGQLILDTQQVLFFKVFFEEPK